jgi:hypothetical protein
MEVLKGRTFCGDNELQGAGIPVPFFLNKNCGWLCASDAAIPSRVRT